MRGLMAFPILGAVVGVNTMRAIDSEARVSVTKPRGHWKALNTATRALRTAY